MLRLAVLVAVVAAGLLPTAGSSVTAAAPRLVVLDRSPLVVRGVGFHAGERVRVRAIVRGGPRVAKWVVAGRRGVLGARFASVRLGRCAFFTVLATGAHGSRASFTFHPPLCGPAD